MKLGQQETYIQTLEDLTNNPKMNKFKVLLSSIFLILLAFVFTNVNTNAQFQAPDYWLKQDGSSFITPLPDTLELGGQAIDYKKSGLMTLM